MVALVVPALAVFAVIGYAADLVSRHALENALGERLCAVAQAAATLLGPRVILLEPGDEASRLKRNAHAKLSALKETTGVDRIFLVRLKNSTAILDTRGHMQIGDEYTRAAFDRHEIARVAAGKSVASVLFQGPDGNPFKTGYAPFKDEEGQILAYVGVKAEANYFESIGSLRSTLFIIALIGFFLLIAAAVVTARHVSVPLSKLSDAAVAVGRGELTAVIPSGGPQEAEVLSRTMRKMVRKLEQRDNERQTMLAGIAHEIRNPLGGMELFGGLLKEDLEPSDPRSKHVDRILGELKNLSRVVNDFLSFARKATPELEKRDVCELLEEVLQLVEKEAHERGITLKAKLGKNLNAQVAPDMLRGAFLNIVQNAIQAAPEALGQVSVTLCHADGDQSISFVCQDNGPGIPKDHRETIFQPFFTTKQKGTGLGLALVKKTVLAHGGTIVVEDNQPQGTSIAITIPCHHPS